MKSFLQAVIFRLLENVSFSYGSWRTSGYRCHSILFSQFNYTLCKEIDKLCGSVHHSNSRLLYTKAKTRKLIHWTNISYSQVYSHKAINMSRLRVISSINDGRISLNKFIASQKTGWIYLDLQRKKLQIN